MNELIRHIEILLLDNDCVVVPGFGGFIAHYMPAVWNETEEMFYPPVRSIGFNTQLKMNDGVLVQSYMKAYGTDFSDATRILQKDVERLTGTLHKEGKIDIANIGEISISAQGLYVFSSYGDKILSPAHYGIDRFTIKALQSLTTTQTAARIPVRPAAPKKNYEIRINRMWVRNVAAAVAAIFLFFYMSDPIENTYVEKHNYAQLLPTDILFEKQSLLTTPVGATDESDKMEAFLKTIDAAPQDTSIKPIVVKEVKVPKQTVSQPSAVATTRYYIIIGSVGFKEDADLAVRNLKPNYPNASVVVGDGKNRISLASYTSREEADRQLMELRKNSTYKDAWLLTR